MWLDTSNTDKLYLYDMLVVADSCWPWFACRALRRLQNPALRGSSLLWSSVLFLPSSGCLLIFYHSSKVSRSTPHGSLLYVTCWVLFFKWKLYYRRYFNYYLFLIRHCRQEYGYHIVATVLYFTAFIVQLAVWSPAISYLTSSNVAAGVTFDWLNNFWTIENR